MGQVVWVSMVPMPMEGSITGLKIIVWPAAGCAAAGDGSGVPVVFVPFPRHCRQSLIPVAPQLMHSYLVPAAVIQPSPSHQVQTALPLPAQFVQVVVSVAAKDVIPAAAMIASAAKQAAANFFI